MLGFFSVLHKFTAGNLIYRRLPKEDSLRSHGCVLKGYHRVHSSPYKQGLQTRGDKWLISLTLGYDASVVSIYLPTQRGDKLMAILT